jgi:hypothetical protein
MALHWHGGEFWAKKKHKYPQERTRGEDRLLMEHLIHYRVFDLVAPKITDSIMRNVFEDICGVHTLEHSNKIYMT